MQYTFCIIYIHVKKLFRTCAGSKNMYVQIYIRTSLHNPSETQRLKRRT